MKTTEESSVERPLPGSRLEKVDNASIMYVTNYIRGKLPHSDRHNVEEDLSWNYVLHKHTDDKKRHHKLTKKKMLTRKERRSLGLTKLIKTGWEYRKLLKINFMWKDYMLSMLNHPKKMPKVEDTDYGTFCNILNKAELLGAEITVVKSNVPSYIGISGIVVLETKFSIQMVTRSSKLNVLLKDKCVFQIHLNSWRFTMFGRHFLIRSGDRSAKKIKHYTFTDL